jgi:hypothetical protein
VGLGFVWGDGLGDLWEMGDLVDLWELANVVDIL